MDILEARKKINELDDQLSALFTERMKMSAAIGEYKFQKGMNILDRSREKEIIEQLCAKTDPLYGPFLQALYSEIFDLSRTLQTQLHEINSIEYGLIGQNVNTSYDKWIHHSLGNRKYGLYDLSKEQLPLLFSKRAFRGLNIGHPYRKEVVQYCDKLDETASEAGYVNTIVKEEGGTLTGYNTACVGILRSAKKAGISFQNKKVMIFGNGAVASCAAKVARDGGAKEVLFVTRTGKVNFSNCIRHTDTDILINGTSIGMAPGADLAPAPLDAFPQLCGVLDAVFTPIDSLLITQAKERNIPCENGLTLLIEKSIRAAELFGFTPEADAYESLYEELTSFIA